MKLANSNRELITQLEAKGIRSQCVLEAMKNVDRKNFVPAQHASRSYADNPLPIGWGQTISQPYIVAFMTEQLDVEPEDRILEIGTGSGYQMAILAELAGHVYGIEKSENLVPFAQHNLSKAGYENIEIIQGDGYDGWEGKAPFDGIMVTAAAVHVPGPLKEQLACSGKMIIPIGGENEVQHLVRIEKDGKGNIFSTFLEAVRFVPMLGRAQEREK